MFRKITELRKSGKLKEAYEISIQEYNKDRSNIYIKGAYSWVLYEYIKKSTNFYEFEKYFKEFLALGIESSGEVNINEIISSKIYTFLKQEANINIYKKLLLYYTKLKLKPSVEIHKFILIDILGKEKDENFKKQFDLLEFLKLVSFEVLKNNNFHENFITDDGIKLPSIFDKIISVIGDKIKNTKDITLLGDINFLEKILRFGLEKDSKWAGYYLGKLYLLRGDLSSALSYIKNVVKKEQTQYWSWHLLGEVLQKLGDENLHFSALSKSLHLGQDDDFLNNLRFEYLLELDKRGYEREANIELNKIIENKTKNGKRINGDILDLKNRKWFNKEIDSNNKSFYKKHTKTIEEYLIKDINQDYILVDWIDENSNRIYFITKNEEKGFFINKRWGNISIHDVLKVKMEKINNKYRVYDFEKYNGDIDSFKKGFKGILKIKEGNSFGFVDNIFIESKYLNELRDGDDFSGVAVKTYDKKKNRFGWKCIMVQS